MATRARHGVVAQASSLLRSRRRNRIRLQEPSLILLCVVSVETFCILSFPVDVGHKHGARSKDLTMKIKRTKGDGNKSLYLVFVRVVFFSASWTAFRAVKTATSWLFS
jgi:hypothetical protein